MVPSARAYTHTQIYLSSSSRSCACMANPGAVESRCCFFAKSLRLKAENLYGILKSRSLPMKVLGPLEAPDSGEDT